MVEKWGPVCDKRLQIFTGAWKYAVSNLGNVRESGYIDAYGRPHIAHSVEPFVEDGSSYLSVELFSTSGDRYIFKVHELVAKAFVPNFIGKTEVRHIDGDTLNNCAANLEWR